MKVLFAVSCAVLLRAQCVPVTGETIRVGELAASNPVFAALAPDVEVGRAPAPGARRVFRTAELVRLARQHQLTAAQFTEVCFAWKMSVPSEESVREAMLASISGRAAQIEIVEQSRFSVPEGKMTFPAQGIAPAPGADRTLLLWKGQVRYSESRTAPIWAKVRIVGPVERVRTRETLLPGEPITAAQVELVRIEGTPVGGTFATALEEVLGRTVRMKVPAGAALRLTELAALPQIAAGQQAQIEVRNGTMRILAEGRAERAGHAGEIIPFTNPATGKRFRARVEGQGRASVTLSPRERGASMRAAAGSEESGGSLP